MPRPRLIVPGSIELTPLSGGVHEIQLGDLAGWMIGESITNWKNSYTFAAIDDLTLDELCRAAPRFAAEWTAIAAEGDRAGGYRGYRDRPAARPHLVRLLQHARILLVAGTDRRDLGPATAIELDGPRRVVDVGFQRVADDYFHVTLRRGAETSASISGALRSILEHIEPEGSGPADDDRTLDRVLRAATSGLVDSAQISLAFWLVDVIDADAWEAHLAALSTRAVEHASLAAAVTRLILDAPPEVDHLVLPEYGEAQRARLPASVLRSAPAGAGDLAADVSMGDEHELALPAESIWTVAEIDDEPVPAPPAGMFAAARRSTLLHGPGTRQAFALAVILVLLVAALVLIARR